MSFSKNIERATHAITKFAEDAGDKTWGTVATAGKLTAGLTPGLILDAARALPGVELKGDDKNKGLGWEDVSTKDTLRRASDLLVGEGTLTGWTIKNTFEAADWLYRNVLENPIETGTYMAFDQTSWAEGWQLAKDRTLGQTITLHANDADQALGTTNGNNVIGIDSRDPNAWQEFIDGAENPTGKYLAGAIDVGAMVVGDPTYAGLKVASKGRRAYREGEQFLGHQFSDAYRQKAWDKLFGKIEPSGKKATIVDDAGDISIVDDASHTPGVLDGWKSIAEVEAGLRLGRNLYAGNDIARALFNTNKIADPVTKINTRRAIAGVLHGSRDSLDELHELDPATARLFSNMMRSRSDAAPIEAATLDASRAGAIAEGKSPSAYQTPAVAADTSNSLQGHSGWERLLGAMRDDRTLRTTASGNRAVAREQRAGLGRDGTLNTGFDQVDKALKPVLRPLSSVLVADSPFTVGAQIVRGGFKEISWGDIGKSALGYGSGVAPVAKGLAKASDRLRDSRVHGVLNVEDPALSVAVARNIVHVGELDGKQAEKYVSQVVNAQTPFHRAEAIQRLQNAAVRNLAGKYGIDAGVAERLGQSGYNYTRGMISAAQAQRYAMVKDASGRYLDQPVVIPGPEGPIALFDKEAGDELLGAAPRHGILNSQGVNNVHILDLERAKKWMARDKFTQNTSAYWARAKHPLRKDLEEKGLAPRTNSRVLDFADGDFAAAFSAMSEGFNGIWKSSVLLSRFGSYAVRNTLEEQLRVWALGYGSAVAEERFRQRPFLDARGVERAPKELQERIALKSEEVDAARAHVRNKKVSEAVEARRATHPDDPEVLDFDQQVSELGRLENELAELNNRARPFAATRKRVVDGVEYETDEALAGATNPFGDLLEGGASGFDTWDRDHALGELVMRQYSRMASDATHHPRPDIMRDDPETIAEWFQEYDHILNFQIRGDAAGFAALEGKADGLTGDALVDHVHDWLKSGKAADYRAQNPVYGQSAETIEQWAHDIANFVDGTVTRPELAARLTGDGKVGAEDLRAMFDGAFDDLPAEGLHRARGSIVMGTKAQAMQNLISSSFKKLDRMSLQRWTRTPMFSAYYEAALDRRLTAWHRGVVAERGEDARVSLDDLNMLYNEARKEALHGIKQTFYDASIRSSAAHQLRFIYPFFAAHQDSVRFWGKTFYENPESYRMLQLGFQTPSNMGLVVDKDGQAKKPGAPVDPLNDRMVTQLPPWLGGRHDVPLSSGMLMLQSGSIFNPGAGPIVSIPVGYFQKHLSHDKDVEIAAKFFNPWGAPKTPGADQALATPFKRLRDLYDAHMNTDSEAYVHLLNIRLQDAYVDYRNEHDGKIPSKKEWDRIVDKQSAMVRAGAWMRLGASLVAPAQPQPASTYSGLRAEYRKLADQQHLDKTLPPYWALNKFIEDHGETYYALTQSQTEMRAHLPPTQQSMAMLKSNKRLVDNISPSAYGLVVGRFGEGEFSTNAYRAMQDVAMNKKGEKMSSPLGVQELRIKTAVGEGWSSYNRELATLQEDSHARGFDLPEEDPAYMAAKKELAQWVGQSNPLWMTHRFDTKVEFDDLLADAETVANYKPFLRDPARGDIRWLKAYVDARKVVQQVLDARGESGVKGGANIDSNANFDLRWAFSKYVAELRDTNADFSDHAFPNLIYRDPFYDEDIIGARTADSGVN